MCLNDGSNKVLFDAAMFLADADPDEVAELIATSWTGHPACQVAEALVESHPAVKSFFQLLRVRQQFRQSTSFRAAIDPLRAITWLRRHRADLVKELCNAGQQRPTRSQACRAAQAG